MITLSSIFVSILAGFVLLMLYERAEHVAAWLVRVQCLLIRSDRRALIEEEWLSIVYDVQGGAWKIVTALGISKILLVAAFRQSYRRIFRKRPGALLIPPEISERMERRLGTDVRYTSRTAEDGTRKSYAIGADGKVVEIDTEALRAYTAKMLRLGHRRF